jgi:peptidoglycan hydrolase-like protein with peptidoglycan-binding domain
MIRLTLSALLLFCALPAAASEDPLQIVVSLDEQQMQVFRGAEMIAEAPVSSGKLGHETPTGVFSILHKKQFHESNLYSNAPMPWMQRLTWTGIALHEGKLPGRPASHGCVRLPKGFAKELFDMTRAGGHVVINSGMIAPRAISHPVLPQPEAPRMPAPVAYNPVPDFNQAASLASGMSTSGSSAQPSVKAKTAKPLRILITRRDRRQAVTEMQEILKRLGHYKGEVDGLVGKATGAAVQSFQELHGLNKTGIFDPATQTAIYKTANIAEPSTGRIFVRQGFEPVFDAPVSIRDIDKPLGTHLFTTSGFDKKNGKSGWNVLTLDNRLTSYKRAIYNMDRKASDLVEPGAALDRIVIPPDVMARLSAMLTPGSSVAISDTGLGPHTGWQTDFIVTTNVSSDRQG